MNWLPGRDVLIDWGFRLAIIAIASLWLFVQPGAKHVDASYRVESVRQ